MTHLCGNGVIELAMVVDPGLAVLSFVTSGVVARLVTVRIKPTLGIALFATRRRQGNGAVHHRLVKVTLNGERVVGQLGDLAPGESLSQTNRSFSRRLAGKGAAKGSLNTDCKS